MVEKKKLPVLDKSLMPEVLPPPTQPGRLAPRDRVRARMRQILERSAALAATANLSGACADSQKGYTVTDYIAEPAGFGGAGALAGRGVDNSLGPAAAGVGSAGSGGMATGGSGPSAGRAAVGGAGAAAIGGGPDSGRGGAGAIGGGGGASGAAAGGGGSGGVGASGRSGAGGIGWGGAGYGVVDPMPQPSSCPVPSAIAVVSNAKWDSNAALLSVQLSLSGTRVTAPYLKEVTAPPNIRASLMGTNAVRLETALRWPASVEVALSLECSSDAGTTSYHFTVQLDTSSPAATGNIPSQIMPDP